MHQFENFEFTGTATISLVVPARTIVRVQSGRLWLTMAGKADDIWLTADEQWQAPNSTRLHLSAEPQACFALGRPVADSQVRKFRPEWLASTQLASA